MDYTDYKVIKELDLKTLNDFFLYYHLASAKKYNLFKDNKILLNNKEAKETDIIHYKDTVRIIYNEEVDFKPIDYTFKVLYEDSYLLIIDKPANLIIHSDTKASDNTLANMVAAYYLENNIQRNVRFAHRLDNETTGVIIFAKDLLTISYMSYIIGNHTLKRYYLAIVAGKMDKKEGFCDFKIGKNRHENGKMIVTKNGLDSYTSYQVLKEYKDYSLVKLSLKTGRTHQIRVHMSYLKHPLLGDLLYGNINAKRCMLHSYQVIFKSPYSNETLDIKAEVPSDMEQLVGKEW